MTATERKIHKEFLKEFNKFCTKSRSCSTCKKFAQINSGEEPFADCLEYVFVQMFIRERGIENV